MWRRTQRIPAIAQLRKRNFQFSRVHIAQGHLNSIHGVKLPCVIQTLTLLEDEYLAQEETNNSPIRSHELHSRLRLLDANGVARTNRAYRLSPLECHAVENQNLSLPIENCLTCSATA